MFLVACVNRDKYRADWVDELPLDSVFLLQSDPDSDAGLYQGSSQDAIKRDSSTDLTTWHRRLGHLGDSMLKKLVSSSAVKGMDVTNTHLEGICEDCIVGKMDEKPFSNRNKHDSQIFWHAPCRPHGTNEPHSQVVS